MKSTFILIAGAVVLAGCAATDQVAPNARQTFARTAAAVDDPVIDVPIKEENLNPVCTPGTQANAAVTEHAPDAFVKICKAKKGHKHKKKK